ncbi:hypothetical protein H2199_007540 [Coniosporium tulheliwenetii]|uniref:Uncharacterized protein n=1 Tax=Coniosporium tulheliwenetii TaxID=3383036 RepID=A0ACC2YQ43_9PEZI|nr:hypothetical protein H2199_007540 [Cladosporium sp. JES 115]
MELNSIPMWTNEEWEVQLAISGTVTEEEEVFRVIDNVAENNDSSSTFAPSVETAHPRGDYSATDHNPAEDDDSFSASDYPRSPSPWQEMQRRVVDEHDNDAKANITHCMKWILHNRLPLMDQQSRFDVRSITDVDESGYDAASTVTEDTSGGSSPTDAGASSNGSPSAAPCLGFGRTSSLGKRATGSQEEGSDQSPGDNRDLKRARTDSFLVPDGKHIRSRRIETGAMKLFTVSNSMYSKIMTPSCGAIGAGAISKLRTMSQAIKKKQALFTFNINGQEFFDFDAAGFDAAGLDDSGNIDELICNSNNSEFVLDVPAMFAAAHVAVGQAEQCTTISAESTLALQKQSAVATLPSQSQPVTPWTTSAADNSSRLVRSNERIQQANAQLRAQRSHLRGRITGIAPLVDRLDELLEEYLGDPTVPEGLHGRISQCHQIVSDLRNLLD